MIWLSLHGQNRKSLLVIFRPKMSWTQSRRTRSFENTFCFHEVNPDFPSSLCFRSLIIIIRNSMKTYYSTITRFIRAICCYTTINHLSFSTVNKCCVCRYQTELACGPKAHFDEYLGWRHEIHLFQTTLNHGGGPSKSAILPTLTAHKNRAIWLNQKIFSQKY